jgi:hypothetical protein
MNAEEIIQEVLQGHLTSPKLSTPRLVKIFIASTRPGEWKCLNLPISPPGVAAVFADSAYVYIYIYIYIYISMLNMQNIYIYIYIHACI